MGHDKLRKFAENETFTCLLQPSAEELLSDGYFALKDHPVKGRWRAFFGNDNPVVLELGCGKGEYTIDLAQRNPSCNYIGVDIKGARLWKGAKFATEHGLKNVAFLRTRIEFIKAFFGPGEVSEIWLTFSDPQIRRENARLSCPLFLSRYKEFLKPGGVVHLKTDSRFLHEYTKAVCAENGLPVLYCTEDLYGSENPGLDPAVTEVQTFYESIFLEQGYKINYLAFSLDGAAEAGRAEAGDAEAGRAEAGDSESGRAEAGRVESGGSEAVRAEAGRVESGDSEAGRAESGRAESGRAESGGSEAVRAESGDAESGRAESGRAESGGSEAVRAESGDAESGRVGGFVNPAGFDAEYWRSVEGPRQLFGRDTAETRRQKLK